ncbi:MAG TPA: DUF4382 domain-containing protein [Terriglobales bacterium]|nr:DUF4382 domain-containing protein [Terriglobales bacterium]
MRFRTAFVLAAVLALLGLSIFTACSGGGSSSRNATTGTVSLSISDPATCMAPQGPYSNVYVTIADVKIHQSSTAGANDSGWIDLTPNLTPTQIDLLGTANTSCLLASLGSNIQIQAGSYQQIRVILLDNSKANQVPNNKCNNNAANCVVLGSDGSKHTLNLSSESQTGIKIPAGQIAGGQFTVEGGSSRDLNIDFNACASIVIQGNGQYRLKPVLHAGQVSLDASSIKGKIINATSQAAISGGKVVVALEQVGTDGIARVIMETVPDGTGGFVFCPVAAGTYYVVATAIDGQGVAYAATVTTGVQPGNNVGNMPLIAQTGTSTGPATITGQVTTQNAANAGTSADISLAALQTVSVGGSNVSVTIPQAATSSATLSLATKTDAACPANTQCVSYTIQVPALNPNIGAFATAGTTYTQAAGATTYLLDALAFVPNSGNTVNCTPSEQKSAAPLAVTAGTTTNAPVLGFTGCQ